MFLQCRARVLLAALACSVVSACGGGLTPLRTQPAAPAAPTPAAVTGPGAPADRTAATSSLGGIVLSEADRTPLSRARIVLTSPALAEPRVAISGADGRYQFTHLPAAAYRVGAIRSGYAPQEYGSRRSGPADSLVLGDGQSRTGIDFALPLAGVIAGVIMDEDGKPFAGATVEALVAHMEAAQPTLVTMATAHTDDRGGFRLTGLAAGQYYVSALDPVFANVGDETGALHYTPTFYPGVVFAEQATRVSVTPAGTAPAITFALKIVRPSRVTGVMAAPDRRPLVSGSLVMAPVQSEALMPIATQDVRIMPDGTFAFRNVRPGRYQIRARGVVDSNSVELFSTYRVIVDGRDLRDVEMTLLPGALVSGMMTIEDGRAATSAAVRARVRAPFTDGSSFGDALTGDVQPDGSYSIRGLMPGAHLITVEGLRDPWVVKRVMYQGRDITDTGFEADPRQRLENVIVTLTDKASDVSGIVRTPGGVAVADAMVLIIPLAETFWTRTSRRLGVLRTDISGRYRLRGLPPGEYRVVASLDVDESDVRLAGVLRDLSGSGIPLTVAGVEAAVLDIPLTSRETLPRTSSR